MKRYQLTPAFVILGLLAVQLVTAQETAVTSSGTAASALNRNILEKISTLAGTYANDPSGSRFAALFPGATGAEWRKIANGHYVSFQDRGRKGRAVFSPEGEMNYAIINCRPEELPETFRARIARDYPACTLLNAIEIRIPGGRTYQAILEHATGYVTLKEAGGGIEVTEQEKM